MPKGTTSRPFNRSERQIAAAQKKLRRATDNSSVNKLNTEDRNKGRTYGVGDAGKKRGTAGEGGVGATTKSKKTGTGKYGGYVQGAGAGSQAARQRGASADKFMAAEIRAGKRDAKGRPKKSGPR